MDTPEIGAAPAAETTAAGDLGDGAQHAAMGRDRPRDAVDPSKTGFLGTLGQFVWGADRAEDGGEPHQGAWGERPKRLPRASRRGPG